MENLDIAKTVASNIASSDITDPVFNAIKKYEYHPSIKKVKHLMGGKGLKFSFNFETKDKILAEIHNLYNHGTFIRTGITCQKILLQKSIEFDIPLK